MSEKNGELEEMFKSTGRQTLHSKIGFLMKRQGIESLRLKQGCKYRSYTPETANQIPQNQRREVYDWLVIAHNNILVRTYSSNKS
jgi:hypothetical protein